MGPGESGISFLALRPTFRMVCSSVFYTIALLSSRYATLRPGPTPGGLQCDWSGVGPGMNTFGSFQAMLTCSHGRDPQS